MFILHVWLATACSYQRRTFGSLTRGNVMGF
jgi:hypothetical protein